MSQMRRTICDLHANRENHVFGLAQTEARHEIVEGILSPEKMAFSLVPGVVTRNAESGAARRNDISALHSAKILEGMEPGEDTASSPGKIAMRIPSATAN